MGNKYGAYADTDWLFDFECEDADPLPHAQSIDARVTRVVLIRLGRESSR